MSPVAADLASADSALAPGAELPAGDELGVELFDELEEPQPSTGATKAHVAIDANTRKRGIPAA
jgi:hypothetical protein